MCGIFAYIGSRLDGPSLIFEGLKALEYRGYDSWGVAAVPMENPTNTTNKQIRPIERIVIRKKIGKIGDATLKDFPKSSFAFGHTRWATHGGVTDVNAHPHLDCSGNLAIIHNGIIENYQELRNKLIKKGHRFISQTDTEVAAHLIEEYGKTVAFTKAVQKAFNDLAGLNAIIVMSARDHTFVAVRNGSPLVVGFGKGKENFLASDAAALLPYTRQVHYLEDEEMVIMSEDGVLLFNVRTGHDIRPKKQQVDWTIAQVEKGKFPYYMLKEIYEQEGLIADIASTGVSQAEKLAGIIKKSYGSYMVACGSASYVCMAGSYLFSKIAKRHINWAVGSEFGYQLDFLTPKSLVMAISQSGETIDTLDSVKKAKAKGAKIFALVNVLGSTLYREADYKMLIGAGPEKAVASTKALTGKLAHLTLLSYAMAGKSREGQKVVMMAAKSIRDILTKKNIALVKKLARLLKTTEHMYVIGRGLSYPASLEAAIKIKEIAYIHAEGLAAGELKHGPLALIEKGSPCIAYLPNDETYGANLAGAMEVKARGGFIIGVSYKPHEVFDYYLPVTDAREATIIPNIIDIQLLAYYLTIERGFDPDMPRNLAKSVTVK